MPGEDDLSVEGDINLAAGVGHTIHVAGDSSCPGGGLMVRAGHGTDGGHLDLAAGNTLSAGVPGSIGIGRVDGSARDITVGRLDSPGQTQKAYFRGTDVYIDAREDLAVRAPGIYLDANSPVNDPSVPRSLRLLVNNSAALSADASSTNLGFAGATAVQAYLGGAIFQKSATGKLAFYDGDPVVRPTVTGSRSDGTALQSLLSALAAMNLIDNQTVP